MTLTENEYNGLEKIAVQTKCDSWFLIEQDENGNDYVYDLENDELLSLDDGISQLSEAIIDPLSAYGLTDEEVSAVENLLTRINQTGE